MKKIISALVLVICSVSVFADYQTTIIDWDAYLTGTGTPYSTSKLEDFVATGHVYHTAVCAAVKMRIYDWTDDVAYANKALELMQAVVDHGDNISDSFFLPYPFTEAYVRIKDAGFMSAELDAALTAFAEANFNPVDINPHADDIHNQHFARAAGLAYASLVWPNSTKASEWLDYANDYFDKVATNGDVVENATNYEYICSFYIWQLADKLGRTDEMDSDNFHSYFKRLRDYIAPSGKTPDYGDSGQVEYDPDWPMSCFTAGYRISSMYRAAAFYNDPTLQWAADEIYQLITTKEQLKDFGYTGEVPLYAMTYMEDWKQQMISQMPEFGSKITTKRYRTNINDPVSDYEDKLILCTSKQPGTPYLLMDLFPPHGSHVHANQQVSINYFEDAGIPLLTTNGYHGWGPESSNLCLIRDSQDGFPYPVPQYKALQWYTTEVPLDNIRSFGPEGQIAFDKINFRMNNTSGTTLAGRFDNMRLTGPAGELLIDGFESLDGWVISGLGSLVNYDKTQGSNSMQIGYTADGTYFNTKSYGLTTVNLSDYTTLKLDWKYSNNFTDVRPFIFRFESTGTTCMSDFQMLFLQMFTRRNKTVASQVGNICYGSVKCDNYFAYDTKFARRMLLTDDGILIVRDDILPGNDVAGSNAGPIWNLSSTAEPQKGGQWVDSNGGSKELFIYMDSVNGADEYNFQTVDISYARSSQRTAYTRKVLQNGTSERFMSVLVPHSPSSDPATIASGTNVVQDVAGFTGSSDVAVTVGGVVKNYKIDVLYEDDTTSTVVYGDTAGMMAINAYDKSPQLRSADKLTFNGSSVQVDYDVSTGTDIVKSMSAYDTVFISYNGAILMESTFTANVQLFYGQQSVSGVVDAQPGTQVKIYSPVADVQLTNGDGSPIIGNYDEQFSVYTFVTGSDVDCQYILQNGMKLDADISGPDGEPDCVVNIYDLAELAKYWLFSLI